MEKQQSKYQIIIYIVIMIIFLIGVYTFFMDDNNQNEMVSKDYTTDNNSETQKETIQSDDMLWNEKSNQLVNTWILETDPQTDKQEYQIDTVIESQENKEKIDEYNFAQLDKVKQVLDNDTNTGYIIKNYLDFNKKFNQDIKPIKNCYFFKTENGEYPYIFWFKLESDKYINKYGTWYYVYPKYDMPYNNLCFWYKYNNPCQDRNYLEFETTISNPCRD